jgi:hemolysin activation/secretion protein
MVAGVAVNQGNSEEAVAARRPGSGLVRDPAVKPVRSLAISAVLMIAMSTPSLVAAQQAPVPAPGQIQPTREEVQRAPLDRPNDQGPRLTVEGGIERAPCALADSTISFTVNSVMFDGLQEMSGEDLRPAYQQYIGTSQPVSVICEIRDRAATILRDAGYIAAVEVPEQRIADGNVRFEVLMAKLVGIRVRGNAGNAEQTIANYLERLTDQPVFNRFQAERYLLLAGDLPGYQVRLALRSAGAGRGEVIGEVAVLRTPGSVDLNVQNFGSRDLGRFGALLRGQFYGLTGLGDRTTIAAFSTLDFDEQQTLQIAHDFRLGSEGLALSGQFTYAWSRPDLGDLLEVDARTLIATAEASYPFLRTQAATIRLAGGLDFINQRVELNDVIELSRDRLRVAYARLDLDAVDDASLNRIGGYSAAEPRWRASGNIEFRKGLDILDASDQCDASNKFCTVAGFSPTSRLEGEATAALVRVEFFGEYRPVPNIAFALGFRGQYSGDKLLSFEEYSAGNYTVGRGYDPGTLLGDRGLGFQAEVRFGTIIPAAVDRFSLQPYVFVDGARVWNEDVAQPYLPGDRELFSGGGGIRALYGDKAQIDVALAIPFQRTGILAERPDPRLLISFTTKLWPWSF